MDVLQRMLSHLFFLHLVVAEPILSTRFYRSLALRLPGDASARCRGYLTLLAWEWAWVLVVAVILIATPHPLVAIGLRRSGPAPFPVEVTAAVAGSAVLSMALTIALSALSTKQRAAMAKLLEPVSALLPTTSAERWLYATLALTAGICEELVYRGFLFFYLGTLGLPPVVIILASGAVFGLGHFYQGWKGVVQTGLGGVAFGVLYWLFDSIVPAMILHALIDLRVLLVWRPDARAVPAETPGTGERSSENVQVCEK